MAILDAALIVSGSKAGRVVGRDGGRRETNKGKLDNRGRSKRFLSQAKQPAVAAKSLGKFDLTVPSVNASSARAGVTSLFRRI